MRFWLKQRRSHKQTTLDRRLRFEQFEVKRMLAVIWANEFDTGINNPQFGQVYGANEVHARALVNRAINDWNQVILDQDFDNDSNPDTNHFMLNVFAQALPPGVRGATEITQMTIGGAGEAG